MLVKSQWCIFHEECEVSLRVGYVIQSPITQTTPFIISEHEMRFVLQPGRRWEMVTNAARCLQHLNPEDQQQQQPPKSCLLLKDGSV